MELLGFVGLAHTGISAHGNWVSMAAQLACSNFWEYTSGPEEKVSGLTWKPSLMARLQVASHVHEHLFSIPGGTGASL